MMLEVSLINNKLFVLLMGGITPSGESQLSQHPVEINGGRCKYIRPGTLFKLNLANGKLFIKQRTKKLCFHLAI